MVIPNKLFKNYQLIDFGRTTRIVNLTTKKFLKPELNNSKYLSVRLWNSNNRFRALIHVLKYESYYGYDVELHGKDSYWTIDHIDGDKTNNSITNLQKITRSQNSIKGGIKKMTQDRLILKNLVNEQCVWNFKQKTNEYKTFGGNEWKNKY